MAHPQSHDLEASYIPLSSLHRISSTLMPNPEVSVVDNILLLGKVVMSILSLTFIWGFGKDACMRPESRSE